MHVEVEAKDSGAKVLEETCSYVRRLQRVMGVTVEKLHSAGLTKGGSTNNAAVFSTSTCLLNPPLRSPEEPCRHKMLGFIGDVSLFACNGSQGLPVANIIAYKVDQSIVERFAQGGRTVITSRVYPTKAIYTAPKVFLFNNATGVSIIANVNVWNMDSAQIEYFPLGQQ